MPIERIEHVQLAMPPGTEEQAVRVYDGHLGITEVQTFSSRGSGRVLVRALRPRLRVRPVRQSHRAHGTGPAGL